MNYKRVFADGHSYFITMVTYHRNPLLIEHIDLLRQAFVMSKTRYDYCLDAIVILPDHLHMIITPQNPQEYPKIITYIKRNFVYGLNDEVKDFAKTNISSSNYRRQHSGIWQDRYYEHTIRNKKDWDEKIEYLRTNPIKHRGLTSLEVHS